MSTPSKKRIKSTSDATTSPSSTQYLYMLIPSADSKTEESYLSGYGQVWHAIVVAKTQTEAQTYHCHGLYQSNGTEWVHLSDAKERYDMYKDGLMKYNGFEIDQEELTLTWCDPTQIDQIKVYVLGEADPKWKRGVVFSGDFMKGEYTNGGFKQGPKNMKDTNVDLEQHN